MIIPKSIVNELSLKSTVLEAVKQGKFTLWAIDHVDQAITILTHSKEALTHLTQDEVEQQRSEIKQAVSTRLKELSMLAAQYLNGDIKAYK